MKIDWVTCRVGEGEGKRREELQSNTRKLGWGGYGDALYFKYGNGFMVFPYPYIQTY